MRCRFCGAEIATNHNNPSTFRAVNPAEVHVHSDMECPTISGEIYGHLPVSTDG